MQRDADRGAVLPDSVTRCSLAAARQTGIILITEKEADWLSLSCSCWRGRYGILKPAETTDYKPEITPIEQLLNAHEPAVHCRAIPSFSKIAQPFMAG